MEEIEEANKTVVGSCHGVLSLLSQQQQDQNRHFRRTFMVETGEVVLKFKRVVSLLHNGFAHGKVRKQRRNFQSPLPQHIFLDNPNPITSAKPLQIIKTLENPYLELGSTSTTSSLQLSQKRIILFCLQTSIIPEFVLFFDCSEEEMDLLGRNQVRQVLLFNLQVLQLFFSWKSICQMKDK